MRTEVASSDATATAAPTAAPTVCPECGGRGWVVAEDGGAGTARRCDCRKRDLGPILLAQAGIPDRYRHCRLDNFEVGAKNRETGRALEGALQRARRYVAEWWDVETARPRTDGLLLIGPPGTGKTHLAAAVLSEIVLRYKARGLFVDFTDLIFRIQSTFDPSSEESAHRVLEPVRRAELLVLDELGAQKPTEFVMNTLYLVMNARYTERRPTIFTTNFLLASPPRRSAPPGPGSASDPGAGTALADDAARSELLASRISSQLVSRLYEMAPRPLIFPDRDFRRLGPPQRRSEAVS